MRGVALACCAVAIAASASAVASCGGEEQTATSDTTTTDDASTSDAHADGAGDAGADTYDACPAAPPDRVRAIYEAVDAARLQARLKEMCGAVPVTVGNDTFSITNRYTPASKQRYRSYWMQQFASLGIPAQELAYPTAHSIGETEGHDMEAVLAGKSPDSIVVIVHYDSMGPPGAETSNPGCDDDMTGMASMLEAARVLSDPCLARDKTIRFVAADYEEQWSPGLEGARWYAQHVKDLAAQKGFQLVAAIDYEQSGWNCASDGVCASDAGGVLFDVESCSGDSYAYDSGTLGDGIEQLAGALASPLVVNRGCMAENSDHYAMWEVGVPAVVTAEYDWRDNPHFDLNGGDTYPKIDPAYHEKIARLSIAFTAKLAGVGP